MCHVLDEAALGDSSTHLDVVAHRRTTGPAPLLLMVGLLMLGRRAVVVVAVSVLVQVVLRCLV